MIAYRQNNAAVQFTPKPKSRKVAKRRDPRPRLEHPGGKASVPDEAILARIAAVVGSGAVGEAQFGRLANRDPNLIADLHLGRKVRAGTLARIVATLEQIEGGAHE